MQFNAGVQPYLHQTEDEIGIWGEEATERKQKMREGLLKELRRVLKAETGIEDLGIESESECVCKYMVDRSHMLAEIQEYAIGLDDADPVAVYGGEQQSRFNHLIEIKEGGGFYLPVYFFFPIWVRPKDLGFPIFVGSAPRLLEELALIDETLEIEKSAKLARMPDFLMANEEQIEDYEYAFGSDDHFWERFTFVLMKKLAERSIEHLMPIIFDA